LAKYSRQANIDQLHFDPDTSLSMEWFPEVRGVTIRGIVREINSKQPIPGIDVMVSILGKNPQLQIFNTDKNGQFLFALNHVKDLTNVYLTLKSPREDELEILVESDFSNDYPVLHNPGLVIDTSMRHLIEEFYINVQVSENQAPIEVKSETQTTAIRFSEPDKSIRLDDYVSMSSLEATLNELVPYVKVRKKSDKYYLEIIDETTKMIYKDPLLLIDNLPIYNVNELLKIHPSVVERIDVLTGTYIYGDHIINGLVAVYTTTDNFGNIVLPASFTSLEFQSTLTPKSISLSTYEQPGNQQSRLADFRNVLYWNPNLSLIENEATFSFYTSDHTSVYDIIVRGTTKGGLTVFGSKSFAVE